MSQVEIAAHSLVGHTLKNGWEVIRKIEPKAGATGGFFSVCYIVKNGEEEAFLKALNFNAFFQLFPGRNMLEILKEQTNAFEFEKELLLACRKSRLSRVSMIIDEGEMFLNEFTIPNVPYLIFEIAEGDVRSNVKFSSNVDMAWKVKSLHDIAVGLNQLHNIGIAHQDLKPSNVLLYESSQISKIGDLGRSLSSTIRAPHDDGVGFTGQMEYSPPEYLYHYIQPDWNSRVKSTDMYLFGSLIVYYFIGVNMTALIGKNLDSRFRWGIFTGSFQEVQDYLIDAFYKSLDEFRNSINNIGFDEELSKIVEYCCYPIPEKRGHKKAQSEVGNQFNFHRAVTKLDMIRRKLSLKLLTA